MKNIKRNFQKVKRKTNYTWTEEDLENPMHKVLSIPGTSIRGVAKKFEIEESTLRFRLYFWCVLDIEKEKRLAKCIGVVCNLGFSPTMEDIRERYHLIIY